MSAVINFSLCFCFTEVVTILFKNVPELEDAKVEKFLTKKGVNFAGQLRRNVKRG